MKRRVLQAPQPDFLHPVRPTPGWAWLWLATSVTVLALGLAEAHQAWQDRELARAALQRLQAGPTESSRPAAVAAAAPRTATARPAASAATESTLWLQRLQQPWPAVFAATEQASVEGIAWLGLVQDDSGRLQLDGLAASAEQALVAAERLRRAGSPGSAGDAWQDVLLARLEPAADGQRFVLQARWAAAQPMPLTPP